MCKGQIIKDIQECKKVRKTKNIFFIISEGLLFVADVIMAVTYLIFALESSFGDNNCFAPFVYVSFILSLIILLISSMSKFKNYVQKNKSFALIMSVFIAFIYAVVRVKWFPGVFQYEDIGTAIIILLSYLIILFEKKRH